MGKYVRHQLDANHRDIVAALKQAGASVDHRGPGDALVGFRGRTFILEIKTRLGRLRPSQESFQLTWRGHYAVVRTLDEALRAIGAIE
jgi:hypothetical protein